MILKWDTSKSVADLLGMNLSPALLGVVGPPPPPSLAGLRAPGLLGDLLPSRDGDRRGVLDGVRLDRDSLSLFSPEPPPPSLEPFRPATTV